MEALQFARKIAVGPWERDGIHGDLGSRGECESFQVGVKVTTPNRDTWFWLVN
jgi:hypothetical protein